MPPPIPHHQQDDNGKNTGQGQDMVGWVKMDEQALVKDFDANLSGLGLELGAGAYNMSEVLNLPIFKQDDAMAANASNQNLPPLQYMLQAPTSPASKVHEETLTYLNQGQAYEIKLKKLRDFPNPGPTKFVKSSLRVVFHDRRLQYTEHQQLEGWKFSRPGDRLVNIDIPMSVGILQPRQPPNLLNFVEFMWDVEKQTSVYIQVHCISTEFTPKKHGGERGVPFRIQIDTYSVDSSGEIGEHIHSASCQIKVFKPKGADRKQKTDKDKMDKRSAQDKLKYQPSYDSTLLTECTPTPKSPYEESINSSSHEHKRQSYSDTPIDTSVDVELPPTVVEYNVMEEESPHSAQVTRSPVGNNYDLLMQAINIHSQHQQDVLQPFFNPAQTSQWLQRNRFPSFVKTFSSFSGSDMFSLTRDDLVQICGPADGIRLYNALRTKKNQTRLTVYMTPSSTQDNDNEMKIYHAFYLEHLTANELIRGATMLFDQGNSGSRLFVTRALYQPAKSNIHVLVTDELVSRFKDEQHFSVILIKNEGGDGYQIILKQ